MQQDIKQEKGLALGVSLIALLVFLLVLALYLGVETGPIKQEPGYVVLALYIQTWGAMFLLSYYFSDKTFFFRWLMWVCENISVPKGRGMAFFYFALAFGLGTMALLNALGFVKL